MTGTANVSRCADEMGLKMQRDVLVDVQTTPGDGTEDAAVQRSSVQGGEGGWRVVGPVLCSRRTPCAQ